MVAYPVCFNGDTLLVLTIQRIAKESDCKVLRRSKHAISIEAMSHVYQDGIDSVAHTEILF